MRLGIIGFGEVGFSFAEGLNKEGMKDILVFDKMWNDPNYKKIIDERRQKVSINLQQDRKSLIEGSDLIITVTKADAALATAKEVLPWLRKGMIYSDFNSSSPMVKKEIAKIIESKGVSFVDGAIMTFPSIDKHKAKIFISGNGAQSFYDFGLKWGMNLTIAGEKPGQAATIKMIRSIFAKGIEVLLLEAFNAAEEYEITDHVFDSMKDFISHRSFDELVNLLIISDVNHSLRRSYEMEDVVKTLKEVGVDATMSKATKLKLEWSASLGLKNVFRNNTPKNYKDVIKAISKI